MPILNEAIWQVDRAIRLVTDLSVAKTVHDSAWIPFGFREAIATLAGVAADCALPKFTGSPYVTACEVASGWGGTLWKGIISAFAL